MNREKGQAFILVLILLAVGSLVLVPTLSYMNTAVRSQRIMKNVMLARYAADAAAEDAIWRLANNIGGIKDALTTASPSQEYTVTVNGVDADIAVQLPSGLPGSDTQNPPGNPERLYAYIERETKWLSTDGGSINYAIQIVPASSNNSVLFTREIRVSLPSSFAVAIGSSRWTRTYAGRTDTLAQPTTRVINGETWYIWDLPSTYERINKSPDTATLRFTATTPAPEGGIYYSKAKILYAGQGQEDPDQFSVTESAPIWIGAYYVVARSQEAETKVFMTLTQSGEAKVFNWRS